MAVNETNFAWILGVGNIKDAGADIETDNRVLTIAVQVDKSPDISRIAGPRTDVIESEMRKEIYLIAR